MTKEKPKRAASEPDITAICYLAAGILMNNAGSGDDYCLERAFCLYDLLQKKLKERQSKQPSKT